MSLLRAMSTVGGLTGLSRIAGFVRDILMASILGAGPVADAFFVALKLPNFFRRVTAEGAFSVSFVPVYSQILEKEGRVEADRFAGNAFVIMAGMLGVFSIAAMLAMPWILYVIAPGFVGDEARYDLAVTLSRITFPYLLLMSLTALLGGVLNALNRFAPFAFAPVLFNLSLIAALLLSALGETAGHTLAWGIVISGLLQLGWLLLCARRAGVHLALSWPSLSAPVKRVFALMGPGVIGAGVMHINLFADIVMASFLPTGSISYLYYADRLNQLPLGVVGIAVGTALLPLLSKALARQDVEEGRALFNKALGYCLLLALPASLALVAIPGTMISALFERGAFDAKDSAATALVLQAYALGLPAYISIKVFSTLHWARQDTITPVRISVIATVVNIVLSILLIQWIGVIGIALGTAFAGWLQFCMHIRALRDHSAAMFEKKFLRNSLWIALGAFSMAVLLFVFDTLLPAFPFAPLQLGALVLGGLLYYGLFVCLSGVLPIQALWSRLRQR